MEPYRTCRICLGPFQVMGVTRIDSELMQWTELELLFCRKCGQYYLREQLSGGGGPVAYYVQRLRGPLRSAEEATVVQNGMKACAGPPDCSGVCAVHSELGRIWASLPEVDRGEEIWA